MSGRAHAGAAASRERVSPTRIMAGKPLTPVLSKSTRSATDPAIAKVPTVPYSTSASLPSSQDAISLPPASFQRGASFPLEVPTAASAQRTRALSPNGESVAKQNGPKVALSGKVLPMSGGSTPLGGSFSVGIGGSYTASGIGSGKIRQLSPTRIEQKVVNASQLGTLPEDIGRLPNTDKIRDVKGEIELDSQIKNMLASVRQNLALAESVGSPTPVAHSPSAPTPSKLGGVEETSSSLALEAIGQERLTRSREMAEIRMKLTSQQEWITQELSRHLAKSAEVPTGAAGDRLLRLEMQVEVMQNQVVSREIAREEARAVLQEGVNAPSTVASLQQAVLTSPNLTQFIQTLVDERVQHAMNAQLRAEIQIIGDELNQELSAFADRLQFESENRAKSVNDLHTRLAKEAACIRAHVEETKLFLQEVAARDRTNHVDEVTELRAIIDSVWAKASRMKDPNSENYYFKYVDQKGDDENEEIPRYKECVGDQEDINTLYEMVREALGDSVMVRRDIEDARDSHDRDTAKLERQLQQLEGRVQKLHVHLGVH